MRPKFVFNTDSSKYSIYNLIDRNDSDVVYFKILSQHNEVLRIVLVIPRPFITRNGVTPSASFGGFRYDNILPEIMNGFNSGVELFKLVSASYFLNYSLVTLDFSIEHLFLLPDDLQIEILMNLDCIK